MLLRSPLFYVGDKYKLIKEIKQYFPPEIKKFIEPFTGGGSVFLNVQAEEYLLNDIDNNVVSLHKFLLSQANNAKQFFKEVREEIKYYQLSRSYTEDIVPSELKTRWPKTYFAKFNKAGYEKLKYDFNKQGKKSPLKLYLLLIYGFNRMLRFNSEGNFNIPVGNVDFNANVVTALNHYFNFVKGKKIKFFIEGFREFLNKVKCQKDDFVYLDPPYLITFSEYNKLWNIKQEKDLLEILDDLNKDKIRFALSNVIHYKGKKNELLISWMRKYNSYKIRSNYISYHNNSAKEITEVLITNHDRERQ